MYKNALWFPGFNSTEFVTNLKYQNYFSLTKKYQYSAYKIKLEKKNDFTTNIHAYILYVYAINAESIYTSRH